MILRCRNAVKIDFSKLGKPTDNAFVESFIGTFRAECLNTLWSLNRPKICSILGTEKLGPSTLRYTKNSLVQSIGHAIRRSIWADRQLKPTGRRTFLARLRPALVGFGCIMGNSAMHLLFILGRYCLITVPSRSRISPQPPFNGLAVKGALAASFSSISMPQPGFSLTHM